MAEHNTLTDPYLHEPKGVAAASAGTTYVADGAGSGSWTNPKLSGQTSATVDEVPVSDGSGGVTFKTMYLHGVEDYDHAGGTQAISATTWTDMLNDGAGTNTNKTFALPGWTDMWDTVNNEFTWADAGFQLGDSVDIRVDIDFTTTVTNQVIRQRIDMAHGDAGAYSLEYDRRLIKSASTINIIAFITVYMGNSATLNNPAKLAIYSDAAGTLQVNGWYIRAYPRNPVFD